MIAVLVLLVVALFYRDFLYVKIAAPLLLLDILFPLAFYYPAILWMGLSNMLGWLVSRLLMSVIFMLVVTPVGLVRKIAGKDSLRLKAFRKSKKSVMEKRDKLFAYNDIKNPF